MLRRLREATRTATVPVRLARATAEAIPVRDGSVDVVVASLVLCSEDDPGSAIREARRALRAGGSLLFFEHVRATEARLARRQDRIERPWGWFSAGCHPNRDTLATIRAEGFRVEAIERWDEPGGGPARPHVLGRATTP
jgi:SAM-dependent methyltransferase